MAAAESKVIGAAVVAYSPPIFAHAQRRGIELRAARTAAGNICCFGICGLDRMPSEDFMEDVLEQCFADPQQWRDNRRSKPIFEHPEFSNKKPHVPLWLKNRHQASWVNSQLGRLDAGGVKSLESVSTSGLKPDDIASPKGQSDQSICMELCKEGRIAEAVDALNQCVQRRRHVDNNVFYRVLKWCISRKDLALGRRVHALTVESGYEGNAFLATHLIGLYASHGRLEEAMRVFVKVSAPDAYNWATIIFAYAKHGETAESAKEAIRLWRRMLETTTIKPDDRLYTAILKACAAVGDVIAGSEVHALILSRAEKPDRFVQAGLVDMYAKCGSLEEARLVFDSLPERTIVARNAMLAGYVQHGMGREALHFYGSTKQEDLNPPSHVTYVCLLQACACVGVEALPQGKRFHAEIQETELQLDPVVGSSLITMYWKCGSLDDARHVFDILPDKSVVTWTAMITGYVQQGMGHEALRLYRSMQHQGLSPPDSVAYVCLLQACAIVGVVALHVGEQLHAQIRAQGLQEDVVLGGSLVNMYAKCGSLKDARSVFDRLTARNVVAWNAILAGYAQQGMGPKALNLFRDMQQDCSSPPDAVTYVCLLQACASVGVEALCQGKQLHAQIDEQGLQDDVILGGSLVSMYVKCGSLEDARQVFDRLPARNHAAWNAMLLGYAQQEMGQKALDLYRNLQDEGLSPDSITYVCLLQACSVVAALDLGKELHGQIKERGLTTDPAVGAALVNMYAKCGSMCESQEVFDSLRERSMEAWNALISGYSSQGDSQAVFYLLDRMKLEGVHPNEITFLCVLTVCSHVGLVDEGRKYFSRMRTDYGISATIEHFTCMVDLLGRAGHLDDALQMVKTMPFAPDDIAWHTLLGACRKWKNIVIGQQAFEGVLSLDEKDAASYVLMSSIYASGNMWQAAKDVQDRRKKSGAWKELGQSWCTDIGGVVQTFAVGGNETAYAGAE